MTLSIDRGARLRRDAMTSNLRRAEEDGVELDPGRRIGPDSEEGRRIAAELGVEWSDEAEPGGVEEVDRATPDYTLPADVWAYRNARRKGEADG